MKAFEQFQPAPAQSPGEDRFLTSEKAADMDQPLRQPTESPLKGVRTNIVHGKVKRVGKSIGQRPNYKKAIVTLREGDSIGVFEG